MYCYDVIAKNSNSPIKPLYLKWRNDKLRSLMNPIVVAPNPYMYQTQYIYETSSLYYTGWIHYNILNPNYYQKNGFITDEMIRHTLKWLLTEMWESYFPFVHGNLTKKNLIVSHDKLWIMFNTYGDSRPLFRFDQHSELYRCVLIFMDLYQFGMTITENNRITCSTYKFPYYDLDALTELNDFIQFQVNWDDYLEYDDIGTNITPIYYHVRHTYYHNKIIKSVHDIIQIIRMY